MASLVFLSLLLTFLQPSHQWNPISSLSLFRNPRKLLQSLMPRTVAQGTLRDPLANPIYPELKSYAPKPPVWPSRFQVDFNEDNYFVFFTLSTTGTYYYDFEGGRVRVDRANGRGDRYCGSALPGYNTPCTHLAVDETRYLVFTAQKYCCRCCSSTQGCGVLARDWLANATYLGHDYIYGLLTTKWNNPGLQNNYYWQTVEDDIPVRLYQEPITQMSFNTHTYLKNPSFNDSLFEPPHNLDCSPQCYGICSLL